MATSLNNVPMTAMTKKIEEPTKTQVLIVGAGPVGLFLGLKLAQQGIKTLVIDQETDIVKSPRAIAYVLRTFETNEDISLLSCMRCKK